MPVRKADNMWSVTVRLIDNDYREVLDVTACQPGMTTHWLGNAKPEMSDCGNFFVLPQFKIFLIAGNSLKKISSESLQLKNVQRLI